MKKLKKLKTSTAVLLGIWLTGLYCAYQLIQQFAILGKATQFPMELEAREGNMWLMVLIQKAGYSLYDHSAAAVTATVYGPLDALIKFWIASALPFLESNEVVRFFVPLIPLLLLILFGITTFPNRKLFLPLSIAFSTVVMIGLLNLLPYNFLAGKPDVTAGVFLILLCAAGTLILRRKEPGHTCLWLFSLAPALCVLTNTRHAPVAAAVWISVVTTKYLSDRKLSLKLVLMAAAGTAGLVGLLVATLFEGDAPLFFKHFYGVLLSAKESGASTFRDHIGEVFPAQILGRSYRWGPVFLPMAFVLAFKWPRQWNKSEIVSGLIVVASWILAYAGITVLYELNIDGGGVHYYSPFVMAAWWWVAQTYTESRLEYKNGMLTAGLAAYLITIPQWQLVPYFEQQFQAYQEPTKAFRSRLTELYAKGELMSEGFHLFKDEMRGSYIDNGDSAERFLKTGYFGATFGRTTEKYFNAVLGGQYTYFLIDGLQSEMVREYLQNSYIEIARAPDYSTWHGRGGCVSYANCTILVRKPQ